MNETALLGQGPYFLKCLNSELDKHIKKFNLSNDVIVFGRSLDSDVYITEDNISKSHALLIKVSSAWYLVDYDSTNGVFINHQGLVSKSPYQLVEGDIFSLGPSEYVSFLFGSQKTKLSENVAKTSNSEAQNSPKIHINGIAKLLKPGNDLELKGIKYECDNLKLHVQKLNDELQSKDLLLESYCCRAKEDQDVISDLTKRIDEMEVKQDEQSKIEANLNQRLEQLMKENENYQEEIDKLEQVQWTNLANLEIQKKEIVRHQNEFQKANEEINMLKKKLEKLTKDFETATGDLKKANLVIERTKSELQSLQNEYKTAISQKAILSNELSKIKCSANDEGFKDMQNHVNLVMENELNCSICSEFFVNAVTLGCSHVFCQFCITSWKKKKLDCPTCRKAITTEALSPVIDNFINKIALYLSNDVKIQRDKIIEERTLKTPQQQQPQRAFNSWSHAEVNVQRQVNQNRNAVNPMASRNPIAHNPPPRRQRRQNYAQAAAGTYDLDFFE